MRPTLSAGILNVTLALAMVLNPITAQAARLGICESILAQGQLTNKKAVLTELKSIEVAFQQLHAEVSQVITVSRQALAPIENAAEKIRKTDEAKLAVAQLLRNLPALLGKVRRGINGFESYPQVNDLLSLDLRAGPVRLDIPLSNKYLSAEEIGDLNLLVNKLEALNAEIAIRQNLVLAEFQEIQCATASACAVGSSKSEDTAVMGVVFAGLVGAILAAAAIFSVSFKVDGERASYVDRQIRNERSYYGGSGSVRQNTYSPSSPSWGNGHPAVGQ